MGHSGKAGNRGDAARSCGEAPARDRTGVAGQWLLSRPCSDKGSWDAGVWMASSLRLLDSLSEVFGLSSPRSNLAGTVEVVLGSESALSIGFGRWFSPSRPALVVGVPEAFLLSARRHQRETLKRLLYRASASDGEARRQHDRRLRSPVRQRAVTRTLVAFVNPASLSEAREKEFTGIPPAAFFMAPALLREGFQVTVDTLVLDAFAAPDLCPAMVRRKARADLEAILARRPLCIAVTAMDLYANSLRAFLREVRVRDREVLLALGGPMVTLYGVRAAVHLPEANLFLRGDGDLAFARTLSALKEQSAAEDLGDLSVRRLCAERGLLVRCGDTLLSGRFDETNFVEDLDSVFRTRIDLGYVEKRHLRKGLSLHTLRGCPYRCTFCAKVHGSRVRRLGGKTLRRILEALEKRIEEIARAEGLAESERREAYRLHITDDDFLLDRRRAQRFFREAAARVPFFLETVPAAIPSFLAAGQRGQRRFFSGLATCLANCRDRIGSFEIGTDDLSERELERLAKAHPGGYDPCEIREVVAGLETLGIRNRHFLLLSNPRTRWPDLFEKIVTLEQWSWEFSRFRPDPNPFVLAPAGTPLFEDLASKGCLDASSKRVFAIEGYPEFTHWAVTVALPDESLFSSPLLSCQKFFQRLVDLIQGPQRFSVFNHVYLQYLLWRRLGDSAEGPEERDAVWRQVQRAVGHRWERIRAWLRGRPFPGSEQGDPFRRENRMVEIFWGLSLVRRTWKELFPEASLDPQENLWGEEQDQGTDVVPSPLARDLDLVPERIAELRHAVRLAEGHAEHLASASGPGARGSDFAKSFVRSVRRGLEERGLSGEASQWETLCAQSRDMVRLEVSPDKSDARIVENPQAIEKVATLMGLAKPDFTGPGAFLPFLRALRVLERTIREDYLETSAEIRRVLYGRLSALPAEFQARFGREFGLCPLGDRDGFLAALLARYLAARAIPHDREIAGTRIFEGLEPVLDTLVPAAIERFAAWLLDPTCRISETRSGRNRSDP